MQVTSYHTSPSPQWSPWHWGPYPSPLLELPVLLGPAPCRPASPRPPPQALAAMLVSIPAFSFHVPRCFPAQGGHSCWTPPPDLSRVGPFSHFRSQLKSPQQRDLLGSYPVKTALPLPHRLCLSPPPPTSLSQPGAWLCGFWCGIFDFGSCLRIT